MTESYRSWVCFDWSDSPRLANQNTDMESLLSVVRTCVVLCILYYMHSEYGTCWVVGGVGICADLYVRSKVKLHAGF